MNALQHHASTRTKDDIENISHVYLDLDHGGTASIEALENSELVPRPNYVLNTSPEKFQVVWKVEGMSAEEAEALNQAMVREFDGDPAATDSTRVLRLPGFANKKYEQDFPVKVHSQTGQTYHPRDFKVRTEPLDAGPARWNQSQDRLAASAGHRNGLPSTEPRELSQSERDWAYAKRALSRGEIPEDII